GRDGRNVSVIEQSALFFANDEVVDMQIAKMAKRAEVLAKAIDRVLTNGRDHLIRLTEERALFLAQLGLELVRELDLFAATGFVKIVGRSNRVAIGIRKKDDGPDERALL